ncbi:MAG: FAD-dependent oxidoreductase [Bacteroidales bacterium]|nr:FAD-dependent oxidoreductase [Bacteroidales bacterium]
MKNTDVLIIGSSAAGLTTAVSGKNNYPEKDFLVIRKEEKIMVPCGIPYIFGSLESSDHNMMPADSKYDALGINHQVGYIEEINREDQVCRLTEGTEIGYKKLVLATGSTPKVPEWLDGKELDNVFAIPKNKYVLDHVKSQLKDAQKVVVVGGGFIGVEFSDELNKAGKEVTIVEVLPHILNVAFDGEFAERAGSILAERGVKVKTGTGVNNIVSNGNGKVKAVELDNGEQIEADAVILSMGYEPNSNLAKNTGLKINEGGYISVDEYMRTNDPNIIAVGDCAEKRHFITKKQSAVMLASTASAEGRIAGMNLFSLSAIKTFTGTIAIYSTAIGDYAFGTAGITETDAKNEGFDVVSGLFEGMDKHPGKLPGAKKQTVKLIVARESGIIIGGEAMGGVSVGELTNLIGFIIQSRTSIYTLLITQIGTQPLLTGSPAAYPLMKAAEAVSNNMKK